MTRILACAAFIWLASSRAQAGELSPQDFAFAVPVLTAKQAAAYRFSLPPAVYHGIIRDDLGDMRVFNANNQSVPYSLRRPAPTANRASAIQLPLFPLPAGSRAVIDGIHVSIDSRGSALNLQTQSSTTANVPVSQYILDGRALASAVAGFTLDWPQSDIQYSGRIRIEASDDLGVWRTVLAQVPIANLRADGGSIIQNNVSIPPTLAKYWRITWLGLPPEFKLTSVRAEPAGTEVDPVRSALEVVGQRDPKSPQDYVFDLAAPLPVDRINLLLPETNTIVNVELSSRRGSQGAWRLITQGGFFRISAADGDQQNSPREVNPDRDRFWRASITSVGAAQEPLRLKVEWIPDEVTFLARGQGPFFLAYGSSAAANAETDLAQLPTDTVIDSAEVGATYILGGPSRLTAQAAPFPRTRFLLWGVLLLAVVGLGWMAIGLLRETRTQRSTPSRRSPY